MSTIHKLMVPLVEACKVNEEACVHREDTNLKSHDMHVLCQQILPTPMRHTLHVGPKTTISKLSVVFQSMCGKVVYVRDMQCLNQYMAEILCMLEACFPPSFWDIMLYIR